MLRPVALSSLRATALLMLCLTLFGARSAPVSAGAWAREKGHGFVSSTSRIAARDSDGPYSIYSTTYLELGLGHDLTLGLDIGHGVSGTSKAVLFMRHPLGELFPGHLFAAEIGVGRIAGEPVLRPGLSYGHGFTTKRGQGGWLAIENFAEFGFATQRVDFKADFTLGLNHGDRFKSIFQMQTGVSHGDPVFARFAPSLVMRMGRVTHVELGLTAGLVGDDQYGVKLGFWRDF